MKKRKRKRKIHFKDERSFLLGHAEQIYDQTYGIDRRDKGAGGGKQKPKCTGEWGDGDND